MSASTKVSVADVRRRVTIDQILSRYGLLNDLKRKGAQLTGCCPVHGGSNNRQFVVNPRTSEWKCFSPECGRGGGVLELVSELEHVRVEEAAVRVAEWFGLTPKAHDQRRRVMAENKPAYKVFAVEDREEGEEDNAFWTRIGSCWKHKDGKGLNIVLNALPIGNRIVLREYTDDDAKQEAERASKRKGARR